LIWPVAGICMFAWALAGFRLDGPTALLAAPPWWLAIAWVLTQFGYRGRARPGPDGSDQDAPG